jgi:hypothetical protein
MYYESMEVPTGNSKTTGALYGRPGSNALGVSSILGQPRGLMQFDGNGVPDGAIFGATGTTFWQGDSAGTQSAFATAIANDGKTAHMVANAASVGQIFVSSGTHGYCLNSGTLTQIAEGANFFGARDVTFIDGYFVVLSNTTNNQQFQISALNDGTTWKGGDVGLLLGQADPLQRVIANLEYLYFFGTRRGEIWYNSGNNLFPFTIESGAFIENGTNAPDSVCQGRTPSGSTSIYWLAQDARGRNIAMRVNGLASERISTHAVESFFASYSTTDDCLCYSYTFHGHSFIRYIFPTANAGWDYDITESGKSGFPVWTEVNLVNGSSILAPFERYSCFAFGLTLYLSGGADSRAGQLYAINPNSLFDCYGYGAFPIVRQRFYRLPWNGGLRTILDRIEIFVNNGAYTYLTSDPIMKLAISQDGGNTYGSDILIHLGDAGVFNLRMVANRLGYYRDGALRITVSDAVDSVLLAAGIYSRAGVT